jgi:hypothetical protein
MRSAVIVLLVLAGADARADSKKKPSDEVDIEELKPRMVFLHDGRGHYAAVVPFDANAPTFYGDGKTFYLQRVWAYSHNKTDERMSFNFWAPTSVPRGGELALQDGRWNVQCSDRTTPLLKLDETETARLLAAATFKKAFWKRRADGLARDGDGTYYYVDRIRDDRPSSEQYGDPHPPTGFRVFIGRKGKLREQKLTDTAVDSKGVVLTTKKGRLSFDHDAKRAIWSRGKKREQLIFLDVEDNVLLIYRDLGIYGRLGVPCDDL